MAGKRGRPSKYTEALSDEICARLEQGEPLMAICRDEHMPEARTVYRWMEADEDFSSRFTRARDIGFDAIAVDALNISDDRDDDPASRRVRVETRLKLLAKWAPNRYGDRQTLEHQGKDGAPLGVVLIPAKADD